MLNIEKYKNELMRGVNVCKIEEIVTEITGKKICSTGVDNCNCCKELICEWLLSECKEQILDDAEKEYLSAVIKPFKSDVVSINKIKMGKCKAFLFIKINGYNSFSLPSFESGKMYRNMELNKEYTLEELGL